MKNYFMERLKLQVWTRFFSYDEVIEIYSALVDKGVTTPLVNEIKSALGIKKGE